MGQTWLLAGKKRNGEMLFGRPKKPILPRDYGFFAAVLSLMDKDNVDKREVQVFVRITTKYVMKNTEKLLSLRKVYCEIVIAQWSPNITK